MNIIYNNGISKNKLDIYKNQPSEFKTRNWVGINEESRVTYNISNQFKFTLQ